MLVGFAFSGISAYAVSADTAGAAILMHADTGEILYSKNIDETMLIASTTKIVTAIVVLNEVSPEEEVTILPEYTGIEGSSMYLEAGQCYTVRELLLGMLLASGNDAATALACYVSGSIEDFSLLMNEYAQSLGLENTQFKNPHGLDADGHYSSAYDLAVITADAMQNDSFCEITATKSVDIGKLTFVNHNKLLWLYSGCLGGKTGYTIAAGRSLVSFAERDGVRLICVTISDPDDWNTHMKLFDYGFENYKYQNIELLETQKSLAVISGASDTVSLELSDEVGILLPKSEAYTCKIELPLFIYAPAEAGKIVGKLCVYSGDTLINETDIVCANTVAIDTKIYLSTWERFKLSWFNISNIGLYYPTY